MTPLDLAHAEIARLRDRVEDLEYEIAEMRGDDDVARDFIRVLCGKYFLRPKAGALLFHLWRARGVELPYEMIAARLWTAAQREKLTDLRRNVQVWICDIRNVLGGQAVLNAFASGYALAPAAIEVVDVLKARFDAKDPSLAILPVPLRIQGRRLPLPKAVPVLDRWEGR